MPAGKLRSSLRPKAKSKPQSNGITNGTGNGTTSGNWTSAGANEGAGEGPLNPKPPSEVAGESGSPRSYADPTQEGLLDGSESVPHKVFCDLPPRVLEPKVLLPFVHVRGKVPRKIEIERKRRQYESQSVEQLCSLAGLPLDAISAREGPTLPLEIFDNTSFDPRTPDEWMSLAHEGVDPKAAETSFYIPAKCLQKDKQSGAWVYKYCRVVDWNKDTNKLRILWGATPTENGEMTTWVPRITTCFLSEDPATYVQRLVHANRQREKVMRWLKYKLCCDSMPTDEMTPIDSAILERITHLGTNIRSLPPEDRRNIKPQEDALVKEFVLDWNRCMNKVMLEHKYFMNECEAEGLVELFNGLSQEDISRGVSPCAPLAPLDKVVSVPPSSRQDFMESNQRFNFSTYFTQPEVIKALASVQEECQKVLEVSLFNLPKERHMSLQEFERKQLDNIEERTAYLKYEWKEKLKDCIIAHIAGVGKGWLNLEEKSKEIYEISKLKKFLTTVKYMMEDTLHFLVLNSITAFAEFIEDVSNFQVKVKDMYTVNNSWPGSDDPAAIEKTPLFTLELVEREGDFSYSTPTDKFEQTIVNLFEKAIISTHDVPQLEKYVMSNYFWPEENGPYCASVTPSDQRVVEMRARVVAALQQSLAPLQDYKDTYLKYTDVIKLDKAAYIKNFQAQCTDPEARNPTEEMSAEIKKHEKKKREVRKEIPHYMEVGNFFVDCTTFRMTMEKKHDELKKGVEDLIKGLAKEKAKTIREQFTKINATLQRPAQTVEALFTTRSYIKKDIPELVYAAPEGLIHRIEDMKTYYAILETFQYQLTDEDFKGKWEAMYWPKKLETQVDLVSKRLDTEGEKLHDAMIVEQEAFKKEIEKVARDVQKFSAQTDLQVNVAQLAGDVKSLQKRINDAKELSAEFNRKQELFGDEVISYRQITEVGKEFKPYADLWITTNDWQNWVEGWHKDPFTSLDPDELKKNVDTAEKVMASLRKVFKDKPQIKIVDEIRMQLQDFSPLVPILQSLRNPGMKERHWLELAGKLPPGTLDQENPEDCIQTLQDCRDRDLVSHKDTIVRVCEVAAKEYGIESSLNEMYGKWKDVVFKIEAYKETKTYMMKGSEEIQARLDEDVNLTQQLSFSPFKGHFEDQIMDWDKSLTLISEILEQWLDCQRNWLYLQPIFSAEDIQVQLPVLAKKFDKVDRTWRKILGQAFQNPNALDFCTKSNKLLDQFIDANKNLEIVQKGLNDYLGEKRQLFGRFYFLSDEELLEILSQSRDPRTIDLHLTKLMEFMQFLDWGEENDEMLGWNSSEGERVSFVKPIYPQGNVEIWLGVIETGMKEGLHEGITIANEEYSKVPRKEWVLQHCGQVVIAVTQIWWTIEIEEALNTDGLPGLERYAQKSENQLLELVDVVQSPLNRMQRVNMGALITIEVHAKDTAKTLFAIKTSSTTDFDWIKQLRYYYDTSDSRCKIKQVDALFVYGGEYLGNTMRLVITPLTDRIYLTLTGALALCLGGAPAGPAGTGKTETTKDLAKALSKQCVVFNCQEGLDFRAMGKFFKGLAMTGAWACFDEFNRIDVEVLSVVAQQVSDLQEALKRQQYRIDFEGSEIVVDPTHAVFITMNPGYAGRTELPDNLKVLFRPVACMVPDYALIGEIRLFSYGYKNARPLSKKMVQTFQLSSEQLSTQDHYDFGMRAVNTVITAAGINKRENPDGEESLLLLRSLRDSNVPKFLHADIVLFENIISDLFPDAVLPEADYGALMEGVHNGITKLGIQPVPEFIVKVIQLFEVTVLRHGLMLVGQAGGGKTMNYKVLQLAMTSIATKREKQGGVDKESKYQRVRTHICNPKSITMNQLYGAYDEATHEWSDGILCVLFRRAAKETSGAKQWVVFDGPVDALWIESMNTVLDDNKKLCLVSGEIIQMTRHMTMMFEVEDLAVASPATVSRCGMIFMEPATCTPTKDRTESWVQRLPDMYKPHAETLREKSLMYIPSCVDFIRWNTVEYVPTVDNNLVDSAFRVMDGFINIFVTAHGGVGEVSEELQAAVASSLLPYFFLSLVWSIGASCNATSRVKFSEYLSDLMKQHEEPILADLSIEYEGRPTTLYDIFYEWEDDKGAGWKHWLQTEPAPSIDPKQKFGDLLVTTKDTVRSNFLCKLIVKTNNHLLATGPTGTGKTLNMQNMIMSGLPEKYSGIFLTFSAQTHSNQCQNTLMGKFEKRKNGMETTSWGPPVGKMFVIFVDDANMPIKEQYGAQPPLELLRQFLDHAGFYNYTPPIKYNEVLDVVLTASMGPPGGGRQSVTNRFLRHFNHISFPELDDESMTLIFSTIMLTRLAAVGLGQEIVDTMHGVISSTIKLFHFACKNFLPTPNHVHYTFNLRDISKVFTLVYDVEPRVVRDQSSIVKLWIHECMRVFRDRLICEADRKTLDSQLDVLCKENLNIEGGLSELITAERLVFGDFMIPDIESRVYDEVTDMQAFVTSISQYLQDYNETADSSRPPMPLVVFLDAAEHVARVSRVLQMPSGHALLLGVGGSGRRSLARLASYIPELEVFYLEITKSFTMTDWKDSLKRLMTDAGVEDKGLVFLFTDTQIVKPIFMEDVANLLGTADVPNLFDGPDLDSIYSYFRSVCQAERLPTTKLSLYSRFIKQVKRNLHIVLAFSPLGEAFRTRMRQFPSLSNCCTIDWYDPWPAEALASVAKVTLQKANCIVVNPDNPEAATIEEGVSNMFTFLHRSATDLTEQFYTERKRITYVTPTSYLGLLQAFQRMLAEKREETTQNKQRLVNGLSKLKVTEDGVAELQEKLQARQPELVKTQQEVKVMMEQIQVDKQEADVARNAAKGEETAASEKAAVCEGIQKQAQAMLDEALPALDEAKKVLRTLKVRDLQEVGKYAAPPGGVLLVMQAVLTIKGRVANKVNKGGQKEEDWWGPAREELRDASGLHEFMLNYEADKMSKTLIGQLQKFIDDDKFSPLEVKKVSVPCAGMCQWVHAMFKYYHVNLEVEPKRRELEGAEKELKVVQDALSVTRKKLDAVETKIAELQSNFDAAISKQKDLQAEVAQTEARLDRAGRLIDGLSGEKSRWIDLVSMYESQEENVLGDVLIASGYVAYLGPYTAEYRQSIALRWIPQLDKLGLKHSENCSLLSCCADPVQIQQWNIQGLPSDNLSTENAIILSKNARWPLMIDPQGQANVWIKNMEGKDVSGRPPLVTCKVSDPKYAQALEGAIRLGATCLLENVQEDLDPLLEPVLLTQTYLAGSTLMMKLGENAIPYDDRFKLFMTTKLPNPHYTPETSVKVSLLNFFITPGGLEDQLLGKLVGKERKDLEDQKNSLTQQNAAMMKELKELQALILRMLQECEGEILDNEELIETLEKSKVKSAEINTAVAEAKKTEVVIDETRNKYRPVAFRAAILFFCVAGLAAVDPMYQYSLQWFMNMFVNAIDKAEQDSVLETRLSNLIEYFTYSFYTNVCRSLFERHKLIFSFCLTVAIIRPEGKVDHNLFRFFLTGPTGQGGNAPNPAPDWVTEVVWNDIQFISNNLEAFKGFAEHFANEHHHYRKVFDSSEPHLQAMHEQWEEKFDPFMKLVFCRVLRADKVILAIQQYVTTYLPEKYIIAPTFDLESSYKDSDPATPLIFILSTGADPMDELQKFSTKMRMNNKMHPISLGQGQGPRAQALMASGIERGTWVVLQNCHLATSWMPKLETIVEGFNPETMKREFRLWLTSMPSKTFPVSVLQIGVKMTNEPPKGLRANLTRSYIGFSEDFLEGSSKPDEFKKLLFSLSLFHAIIQDRRGYGSLGFNIPYEFNDSDLKCCNRQLDKFINMYDEVPFPVLHFLTGHVNYGGRVTDDWDRRCLMTLLDDYMAEKVLENGYQFSPSGVYETLTGTNRTAYLDYLETRPLNAAPEMFGLHDNADITSARARTFNFLETVLLMESGGSSAGGKSREEILAETASDILCKIPPEFNVREVQAKYPVTYKESMNTVLVQEAVRYNKLLKISARSLKDFTRALRGEVVMAADLEELGNSLFVNQVPTKWASAAYPSLKSLSDWVKDLLCRVKFIKDWYEQGHPVVYWLSGFYFPQAFMTGSKQNFARAMQISIDTVSFNTLVLAEDNPDKRPEHGTYVNGLFMEGARWDKSQSSVIESRPKELYTTMPPFWFQPVQHRKPPESQYHCPLYKTLTRAGTLSTTGHSTNFVMTLEIPIDISEAHWIKRGVACVLALT
eukprot:TRINITY_DN1209_c2_g1_i1.p1 TRINITY_DN1209_c2_g1~~TRINITY_DN1209_c2_g1_i1.p1  ORF type:complete len:4214 (+),score=1112.95 TRINITY_DN1209_c2_g1_i1:49-12642(+)